MDVTVLRQAHLYLNAMRRGNSKRSNVMVLQDIVGVLIPLEIKFPIHIADIRNQNANDVSRGVFYIY